MFIAQINLYVKFVLPEGTKKRITGLSIFEIELLKICRRFQIGWLNYFLKRGKFYRISMLLYVGLKKFSSKL